MPRKSSEALSTIQAIVPERRPEPPDELNEVESEEWRNIVGAMPHDWFTREMWPLLSAMCANITIRKNIARELRAMNPREPKFSELSKLQLKYCEVIAMLATRLRLTAQSRHTPNVARRATKEATAARNHLNPWDKDAAA